MPYFPPGDGEFRVFGGFHKGEPVLCLTMHTGEWRGCMQVARDGTVTRALNGSVVDEWPASNLPWLDVFTRQEPKLVEFRRQWSAVKTKRQGEAFWARAFKYFRIESHRANYGKDAWHKHRMPVIKSV